MSRPRRARQRQSRHRRDWEELAAVDPLWALMKATAELGRPQPRRVLDFGCGVGRLARPFAARFDEYVGADVAS